MTHFVVHFVFFFFSPIITNLTDEHNVITYILRITVLMVPLGHVMVFVLFMLFFFVLKKDVPCLQKKNLGWKYSLILTSV